MSKSKVVNLKIGTGITTTTKTNKPKRETSLIVRESSSELLRERPVSTNDGVPSLVFYRSDVL
jgi:hypothetical protein